MYRLAYEEALSDSPLETRAREREAIDRSIEYMEAAELAGPMSRESVIAVNFLRQLWTILIEELANGQNALPPLLRAQVISIGLWILRQAEDISQGGHSSFRSTIDISKLIREGLE
jgi:flagellar protein FlaF